MENQSPSITEPQNVWMRGLFMLLFAFLFGIGHMVLNAITVVQFLWLLFTREPNRFLSRFGLSLAKWFGEVTQFQTAATGDKPFPWRDWPQSV
ncbi:MAG: DUF4389 domain-containing protein [Rhodomicrobium sp.]